MSTEYIELSDYGYRVAGTRVSLDSIVWSYYAGQTAEDIAQSFPALTLEQVYGALAYYLAHRSTIDEQLREASAGFDALRLETRRRNPELYRKLADARRMQQASG